MPHSSKQELSPSDTKLQQAEQLLLQMKRVEKLAKMIQSMIREEQNSADILQHLASLHTSVRHAFTSMLTEYLRTLTDDEGEQHKSAARLKEMISHLR